MSFSAPQLGAIVDHTGRLTASALREAISSRKGELAAQGCGEGTVVALVQPNEAEFFVNLFAVWELGGCVVPLSPSAAPPELDRLLEHAGCAIWFRNGRLARHPTASATPLPGTALLLYTSGSTGAPKGVKLPYAAVRAKLATLAARQPPEVLARTLCFLPVSFGHGLLGNSLPALLSGGELHLRPAFSTELAASLGELVDELAITFFSSVPAVWATAVPFAAPPKAGSLRRVFCASAGLSVELWLEARRWLGEAVDFRNVYGITEAASWISALPEGVPYSENGAVGSGWDCELRVHDATGEVLVRAPYLMSGYHRDPAATAATLRDGWLHTGDTGELHAGTGLRLLGRIKDQISRGGMKVSPVEVEECLLRHPAVAECCVFGTPDPVSGETVAAAVVTAGPAPSAAELRVFCRQYLSEFKIPERFFFVDSIPRNERGKVIRAEVAAACGGRR